MNAGSEPAMPLPILQPCGTWPKTLFERLRQKLLFASSVKLLHGMTRFSSASLPNNHVHPIPLMNRTIKDATVKRYHYKSQEHLRTFLDAYNFARRLKTPRA